MTNKQLIFEIDITSNKCTSLMKMILLNIELDVIKSYLVNLGEKINDQNENGWTALMIACRCNHPEVVDELLQNNANTELTNDRGRTALMIACHYDSNIAIIKSLLEHGASVNRQCFEDTTGYSALMIALSHSRTIETIEILLKYGVDVNMLDDCQYNSLLHCTLDLNDDDTKSDFVEQAVRLLIKYKVNINYFSQDERWTALHNIVKFGKPSYILKVMEMLLMYGANPNIQCDTGHTPLMFVLMFVDKRIVKSAVEIMLKYGADVNIESSPGFNALKHCINQGFNYDMIDLLIEHGAQITNIEDYDGDLVKYMQLKKQNVEMTKEIKKLKAEINIIIK